MCIRDSINTVIKEEFDVDAHINTVIKEEFDVDDNHSLSVEEVWKIINSFELYFHLHLN